MRLERTQGLFFEGITSPLPEDIAVVAADESWTAKFTAIANEIIKPGSKLSAAERLSLYHKQYWYRLIDCLYDDFPGLRAVLGDKTFYKIVLNYLNTTGSRDFNLRNLGRTMPEFIAASELVPKARRTAALDMARLEWASVEAFDNASLPVIDTSKISLCDVATLQLALQPYVSLLELSYPWDQLICDLKRKERDRSEAATGEMQEHAKVRPLELPKREKLCLVVHRFNSGIFYKRVSAAAFQLLSALKAGEVLSTAFEQAIPFLSEEESAKPGETLTAWFEDWTSLGWLATAAALTTTPAAEQRI